MTSGMSGAWGTGANHLVSSLVVVDWHPLMRHASSINNVAIFASAKTYDADHALGLRCYITFLFLCGTASVTSVYIMLQTLINLTQGGHFLVFFTAPV
jgi:hypothetical protein